MFRSLSLCVFARRLKTDFRYLDEIFSLFEIFNALGECGEKSG